MQHDLLQPRLPEDAECALKVDDRVRVRERGIVTLNDGAADDEVQEERQRDEQDLEDVAVDAVLLQHGGQALCSRQCARVDGRRSHACA